MTGTPATAQRTDGQPTSVWDGRVRPVTVGATALIALFAVEYVAVGTAMPTVARDLDGLELYALAFGATVAASVIGMILGGWWSDHSGPRAVIVTGGSTFAAGLLVAGLAPTMEVFVLGRGVQGLGGGLSTVAVYVVIAQGVPDALRPQVFSLLAAAWVVPGLVGPFLTGLVVEHWGWRWVFVGVAPLVVAGLAVLLPALGRTRRAEDAPYLSVATVLWAVVAAACVCVLNLAGKEVTAAEAVAAVPFVAGVGVAAWRLLPPGTLRFGRGLPSVFGARGAIGATILAAEAYLPLMLQERHGWTPAQAGGALAVGAVTWATGSWLQGRLRADADRFTVLVVGSTTIVLGVCALLVSVWLDWPGWTVLLVWGVALLGVGAAFPTTSLLTMRLSPPEQLGRNSSSLQISEALASAVVLAGAGAVFTALYAGSPHLAFVAVCVAAVLTGLAALLTSLRARPASSPAGR